MDALTPPTDQRGRFDRIILPGGDEPDPRFTLANERTYLAWTRTALAFLAGGVGLEAFPIEGIVEELRHIIALMIILVGLCIAGGAAVRWVRVERALREAKPLPTPAIIPLLSLVTIAACALGLWVFA